MTKTQHMKEGSARRRGRFSPAVLVFFGILILASCVGPNGADPNIINLDPDPDTVSFTREPVKVQSSIRFEAQVDTVGFPYRQFTGTRLKIALVCIPPPGEDSVTFLTIATFSANYLDLPAVSLPLNMIIPETHFRYYDVVRVAIATVVLFRDENENNKFDPGETVFGAGENSVYAYIEGKSDRLPFISSGIPRIGSNLLVRVGSGEEVKFYPSPDYSATIFIIQVRGEKQQYAFPYPWTVSGILQ